MSVSTASQPSAFQAWMLAIRPKTLPAGAMPVVIGSALAAADGVFRLLPALVALICALGIQIVTNFINEIYDFRKGADTAERLGPTRTVAAGIITGQTMTRVSIALGISVFVLGLYLVAIGGWPIFLIGVLSLLFAWAYTGGPFPIAYCGLGDVFVFIFFGLVAVGGTYYVQALSLPTAVLVAAAAPGAFSVCILLVNNIRDIATDRKVGKMTLPARIGAPAARALYVALTVLAYAVPVWLVVSAGYSPWCLASLVSLPLAIGQVRTLYASEGRALNAVLAGTGKVLTVHGALFSAGLVIPNIISIFRP
ncbi:MAG TPA: 1,4-dihydroxy-2-naphthoate polyprenyltransferase [Chlorobaculum parvum]|uniref:1,4-dihydroxy-2-naphthoate octaprenyltransferase n=1 Tax=Chlorobaculum parvum TaxID=274539 RepID=A0A7C5HHN8_9CHLB|nr:1,4-dihydroxy-2-naphthoate polyprenyltransferase [Chlorobaculum parvum]